MHCIKCGTSMPDGAAFCPNCGQPVASETAARPNERPHPTENADRAGPPPAPEKKRKLLGCLIAAAGLVFLLALLGQCAGDPDADPNTATGGGSSTSGEVAPDDLPLAVTAIQLFQAFENNEASAQGYFGKRKLLVSGTVDKVTLDLMDDPVVNLRTSNQFMSAHAELAKDAQGEAGNFNSGDKVQLLCEDVSEVIGVPMLKECRTAPPGTKSQPIKWAD